MLQKIKSLSLERQLFLSFSAVSALLLMLSLGITLYFDIARQSQSIDSTISSTAAYVASMDGVAEMLANGYPTQEVTGSLDSLHQNFPGIDIIAVYDRNGLRFYHTSRLETGETFVAGEETAILSGSPPYITTGYGTHGNQRVAFHAVRDGSGSIIGFVTAAIFRADILQRSLNLVLLFSLVLGGMFGVALLLARGIVHLGTTPRNCWTSTYSRTTCSTPSRTAWWPPTCGGRWSLPTTRPGPCSSAAPPPWRDSR